MKPSWARVYYYGFLAWRRQDPLAVIDPRAPMLSEGDARRFLAQARQIARNLAADFKWATELVEKKLPKAQDFLKKHPLLSAPHLNWAPEHLLGIHEPLRQRWQQIWKDTWLAARQEHLARLLPVLSLELLLVRPVAYPPASREAALEALCQQLEADAQTRLLGIPPEDAHVYTEPLSEWLMRPLLSGQWFFQLCQALAELTRAVPALVQQRAAEQEAKSKRAPKQGRADSHKSDVPPMPQGVVSAEALFYYAVSAYRTAYLRAQQAKTPSFPTRGTCHQSSSGSWWRWQFRRQNTCSGRTRRSRCQPRRQNAGTCCAKGCCHGGCARSTRT